jgi:hypothetical protein
MADNYDFAGEREIRNKLMEYRALTGQLRRYWRRLAQESLRIAKEKGLVVRIGGEERLIEDCNELFKLAKDKFPSLYRRYNSKMSKHEQLERALADASEKLTVERGL